MAALIGATVLTMSRPEKKPISDTTECLTTKSCGEGWRCYAEPKDDPFATSGVCSQTCESSLQCATHFKCVAVSKTKDQVVPVGARGATEALEKVCRPCGGVCDPE